MNKTLTIALLALCVAPFSIFAMAQPKTTTSVNNDFIVKLLKERDAQKALTWVQEWLAKDYPIDAVSTDGRTALMCAAARGHFTVAQYLCQKGANVNA